MLLPVFLKLRGAVRQEGSAGVALSPSRLRELGRRKTAGKRCGKRWETKSVPPLPIPSWRLSTNSTTLCNESVFLLLKGGYFQSYSEIITMVEGDPQEDAKQLPLPLPIHAAPPLGNVPPPPVHTMELQPQRTWTTLVEEAELPLHSHAFQIFQQHQEEEWEVTMRPFTRLVEAARNPNYNAEEIMFEFADSLEHPFFLVVKDTKFQVIHGMRQCTPIHGLGARLSWLLGDRQLIAGQVVPPGLIIKAQGQNIQSDLFARIATNAVPLDAILLAFQADPTVALHDPEPAHTISSWAVLPIPGRFACLFMKGLSLIEGFVLGCKLLHLTPDRFAEEKELWAGFLRSAVTRRTVGEDTSALLGVGDRSDLTMTTIDLLQAMTERLSNGALAGRSTVKNYDWVELEYLFQRIGALQIGGSFTGLGTESLPEFFQSLAMARGDKANT
jgi:hypothetical protein